MLFHFDPSNVQPAEGLWDHFVIPCTLSTELGGVQPGGGKKQLLLEV